MRTNLWILLLFVGCGTAKSTKTSTTLSHGAAAIGGGAALHFLERRNGAKSELRFLQCQSHISVMENQLKDALNPIKEQNERLLHDNEHLCLNIQRAANENALLFADNEKLNLDVQRAVDENALLLADNDKMKARVTELEEVVNLVKTQLTALALEKTTAEERMAETHAQEVDTLQTQLETSEKRLNELTTSNRVLTIENDCLLGYTERILNKYEKKTERFLPF